MKTSDKFCTELEKLKGKNLLIQIQNPKKAYIVPHFPCNLIQEEELLIEVIPASSGEASDENMPPGEDKNYIKFYIDSRGGSKTKSKQLVKNKRHESNCPLCIFAFNEETVEDALQRDGRFSDIVFQRNCNFKDKERGSAFQITQNVTHLSERHFEICLGSGDRQNPKTRAHGTFKSPEHSTNAQHKSEGESDSKYQETCSKEAAVKSPMKKKQKRLGLTHSEIRSILLNQFEGLVEQMKSRYKKKNFSSLLSYLKGEFGKSTQGFSEAYRIKKLMGLGNSVCMVNAAKQGTGFLLFSNYILTNAHLLESNGNMLADGQTLLCEVTATFNYENPDGSNQVVKKIKNVIDCHWGQDPYGRYVDFAVLELEDDAHPFTGLLREYGPAPTSAGVCIIGHPDGKVKRMDPTTVIEKEKRPETMNKRIGENQENFFLIRESLIQNKEVWARLMKPDNSDITYDTCLFHGASGSPAFDELCQVFGMHTGGLPYEAEGTKSVIEYSIPLLTILENFLISMMNRNEVEILTKFTEEAMLCPNLLDLVGRFFGHMLISWQPSYDAVLTNVWKTVEANERHRKHVLAKLLVMIKVDVDVNTLREKMQKPENEILRIFISTLFPNVL